MYETGQETTLKDVQYSGVADPDVAEAAVRMEEQYEAFQKALADQQNQGTLANLRTWLSQTTYNLPNSAWVVGAALFGYWWFRKPRR